MTKAGDQFRQSDVTFWGFAALGCGVLAVVAANVSALIPEGAFLGLHLSRLEGGSITELRQKVADLSADAARLRQDTRQNQARLTLNENTNGDIARRVGALEVTLPALAEANVGGIGLDRSIMTSAIATSPQADTVPADGGMVAIRQTPLDIAGTQPADTQPIPAPLPSAQFGIAIGPPIASAQAKATWDDLSLKLGSALLGLNPLMNGGTFAGDGHLVAGPIADVKDATALCKRLEAVAVACLPVPYIGARITN